MNPVSIETAELFSRLLFDVINHDPQQFHAYLRMNNLIHQWEPSTSKQICVDSLIVEL